ncbi:CRTAC1 family protein, partial [Thermogutta sp.]|uniref:CRTAC1 family protein n=1 Tax=Thermogutta sp. TaxID=1962930 RepID=UPI00321F9DA0
SRFTSNGEALAPLLLINNRDGTFEEKAAAWGLGTPQFSAVATSWLDIDNDRDLDLILASGKGSPVIWLNDRAGAFRIVKGSDLGLNVPGVSGLTTGDVNCDGRPDLVLLTGGRVRLFLNEGACHFREEEKFARQFGRLGGTIAQLADVDNDGDADLFIADAYSPNGQRQPVLLLNSWPKQGFVNVCQEDPRFLFCGLRNQGNTAGVLADFDNDGGLDVLVAPLNTTAVWFKNCGPRGNWISLDLAGTRYTDQKSRSNESAIGARVQVRTGQIFQQWDVGQIAGSTCWAPLRLHFGLGQQQEVEWLRIIWPDAVLQSEVAVKANQVANIGEVPRKTSSCPHLFVWTGTRFEFVSDFGGKGGLGYLIRPGIYAKPYPVEYVPLPPLKHSTDSVVCKIIEPLEEVVYFDHASLIAVDHPAGTYVLPNEMMPVSLENIPEEILCFGEELDPVVATNDLGQDVLPILKNVDRDCVGPTEQEKRFVGYAKEYSIVLQFPGTIDQWLESGRRVFFIGYGWVEYSYSQTNYAAAQAGISLKAPTFEVLRGEKWVELAREAGYPAGLNHWMTLELTHLLQKGDRTLRIRTNMDLYWDRIFLAATSDGKIRQLEVHPSIANLTYRGFPREYTPDGRQPTLLDYENIDLTLPWKCMAGYYTRFGDVKELVLKRDDAFVIMGPGEELTLEFDISELPKPPTGFIRSWILKTDSFCKDMDIHTAAGDQVEPLPFHAMRSYPYSPPEKFPETVETIRAKEVYNTRWMGVGNEKWSDFISQNER